VGDEATGLGGFGPAAEVIGAEIVIELGRCSSEGDELIRKCYTEHPTSEQISDLDRSLAMINL
jgi:hypothetical protein